MSTRSARIEVVPPYAVCSPHPLDEGCPITEARDEQCLRYLAPSQVPHHLRLVAGNGKVLASSENYANRTNAVRAIEAWAFALCDVLGLDHGWFVRDLVHDNVVVLDIDGQVVR